MLTITLYSTPICRRYQKMRRLALDEAVRLNLTIQTDEISAIDQLMEFSPLRLLGLSVNGQIVASQNLPKVEQMTECFVQEKDLRTLAATL